jgi:hypothetical protein
MHHLSQCCLYCSYLWSSYLKTEPTICMYNNSKNFTFLQTIFQRVSVADTAIVREVHLCEPKHCSCKLSVLWTQRFTLGPHHHGACWDAPCVVGDAKWICVCVCVCVCVHDKNDRQLTTAMFLFAEVDFSDDDGGCHRNMMERSLTVYEIFWIMYACCRFSC